jgi:DNA-binding NarL/FixJ family response regulator
MYPNDRWNILFIIEENSDLDSNTPTFEAVFNHVDKTKGSDGTLASVDKNLYDIVIGDISVDVMEGIMLLKQIKEKKPDQSIFALVSPKDTDKLYLIANLGINAFELNAETFDLALEEIAKFDPYAQES